MCDEGNVLERRTIPESDERSAPQPASSPDVDRRAALLAIGGGLATMSLASAIAQPAPATEPQLLPGARPAPDAVDFGWDAVKGEYALRPLPYDKAALEPHIDAQTMDIHHGKHHAAYVTGLNRALAALKAIREGAGDAALIKHWSREVAFHGSGHVNHALFWHMMAPPGSGGGGRPGGPLAAAIDRDFGSFEAFAAHFKAASVGVEASGWGWLVFEPVAHRLLVLTGEKQQNLTITGVRPLLGIDVWEHAYYLKYQNRRADYVNAFMNVINWPFVSKLFASATETPVKPARP